MIGNKRFDCEEMFRHACAFCECADMALEKFSHKSADISWYDIPAGVNSAFACEVFLKTILKWNQIRFEKEHNLVGLFNLLPEDIKVSIQNELEIGYGGFTKDYVKRKYFDNINKSFVNWRYSYEHDFLIQGSMRFEIGFLIEFRNLLRETCSQLLFRKTWEEYSKGEK